MVKYRRWIISAEERNALESSYALNPFPTVDERARLAEQFNKTNRQVQVWFQNQRMRRHIDNGLAAGKECVPATNRVIESSVSPATAKGAPDCSAVVWHTSVASPPPLPNLCLYAPTIPAPLQCVPYDARWESVEFLIQNTRDVGDENVSSIAVMTGTTTSFVRSVAQVMLA
jgi:hypothetical protein